MASPAHQFFESLYRSRRMQQQGFDVRSQHVILNGLAPDDWETVTCKGCGATAQVPPGAVPEGYAAACPDCQRKYGLGD